MKFLIFFVIKMYWITIPKSRRRKCLFRESCSNYVYQETKYKGAISGLKAFLFRVRNCNSNHHLIKVEDKIILITKDQHVFTEEKISKYMIDSY